MLLLPQLPLHGPSLVMPRASPRQSKANQDNEDDQSQTQHLHHQGTVPQFPADESNQQRSLGQRYTECGSVGGGHGPPSVMSRASHRQGRANEDAEEQQQSQQIERRLSQRYSVSGANDTASICLRGADTGSVCSSATRHWVNSVSDIYGPDEIEELLEDLNKLELAAFETDEDFDIDGSQIGGGRRWRRSWSRSRSRNRFNSSGVYNSRPALAPHSSIGSGIGAFVREASPTPSDRSWDSHAVYQVPNEDEDEVDLSRRRSKKRGRLRDDWEEQEGEKTKVQDEEEENNQGEDDCDDGLEGIFQSKSILCYCDTSTFKTPRTALRVLLLVSIYRIYICKQFKTHYS